MHYIGAPISSVFGDVFLSPLLKRAYLANRMDIQTGAEIA
jgi:hypothetical protein